MTVLQQKSENETEFNFDEKHPENIQSSLRQYQNFANARPITHI